MRQGKLESVPVRWSRRALAVVACAIAVIVGMVVLADHASQQADDARQSQVLMERVRAASEKVDRLTWETMATSASADHPNSALIASGLNTYRDLTASLRQLHRLGRATQSVTDIEKRVGAAYGVGLRALLVSRTNPVAARRMAVATFTPAMERLDSEVTAAVKRQATIASTAQRRARLSSLGSLVIGLVLLMLLGWRLHRMQRNAAVTEHGRAAERRGEERMRAILRHSSDVAAVVDASSCIQWVAESVERVLEHDAATLIGKPFSDLVHQDDKPRAQHFIGRALGREEGIDRERLRMCPPSGDCRHVELVAENRLADPLVEGVLLNLRDVSKRIELEEQLRHQAFHDTLTGLANRALFEDRLIQALARERRHGRTLAVIYVDLDDFKTVNDSLGHAVGDQVLQSVAARLDSAVRPEDTAARLGGDEFAILIEELEEPEYAVRVAERFLRELEPPFELAGRMVKVGASIGVAYADGSAVASDVLSNADVTMYAAKELGKGRVASFEPAMHERVLERLELTSDLNAALGNGQLTLVYQPVVALGAGTLVGVEALLRWNHPSRGLVGPDRFIPLAESTGLIVPIGRWVLRSACEQLRRWQSEWPAANRLEMSVNVSTRQLAEPSFPADVRAALEETGVAPDLLVLEITERLLAEDSDHMLRQLHELKEIGVHLAIDDFGTGYSGLSYLRSFPVDLLKIDRSFMPGIADDDEKARLVRGIIDMGRALGLEIVTEGIELPEQSALMRELGADYGQGYLFSRPVEATAIERLLLDNGPMPLPESAADFQS